MALQQSKKQANLNGGRRGNYPDPDGPQKGTIPSNYKPMTFYL